MSIASEHVRRIFDPFTGPSGRTLTEGDVSVIELLAAAGTFGYSDVPIRLRSSQTPSRFYARLRAEVTRDHPDVLAILGKYLARRIINLRTFTGPKFCIIGIPTAGQPLAQMVATEHNLSKLPRELPIGFLPLRATPKILEGREVWIDPPVEGFTYISIENASTTGDSILRELMKLEATGYKTKEHMHHVIVIDRGGAKRLKQAGYEHVYVVWDLHDIIALLVNYNIWPRERLAQYEDEMKAAAK